MSGLKAKIDKAEVAIFLTKTGGVDQRILESLLAINDRLNALKAGFNREKQFKWFKVFNELPREETYEECLEQARKLTLEHGTFENYIVYKKANPPKMTPEKEQIFKQIFRD